MTGRARCRNLLYRHIPLARRLALAEWACGLGGQHWAPALIPALMADLAQTDPAAYHHFLWSHHLTPARWFAARRSFGMLAPSRRLLLADIGATLGPGSSVASALDAGCSAGYLLRAWESRARTPAARLVGFDVDREALRQGQRYLAGVGSCVRLVAGDLRSPPAEAQGSFDLVFCTGVLMYLREAEAGAVVARLLSQARRLLSLSGPAWRQGDNRDLAASVRREDATFLHNLDAMVAAAGGEVVRRRWHGARRLGGQTIYFVLARGVAPIPAGDGEPALIAKSPEPN